jgi:outer membrane protein TolC
MKKFVFLIILTFSFSSAQKITLKDALQLGLNKSKNISIAKSKLNHSEARLSEVNSQFYPQLKFSASYIRLSEIPSFEISIPFSPKPIKVQDAILNNYQLKLSLMQPIFTGFRLSSLKNSGQYNITSAEYEVNKELNDEAMVVHQNFWNYYKAIKLKEIVDENLNQMEAHLTDTKSFYNNELLTKNDLLRVEVMVSTVRLKQIESENFVNFSRAILNKSIALPISDKTEIDAEVMHYDKPDYFFEELIKEAKNNRNELKSIENKINSSKEGITIANSSWFPSLYLFSNIYYNKPNQRIMPSKDQFDDTWDVGLTLNWDLNWNTSSLKEQAEQNVKQVSLFYEQMNDGIEIEVYNNYLQTITTYNKILVSEKNVLQSEENYSIIKNKFDLHLATTTELIDASTLLFQAKTELTNTLIDYQLQKVKLNKSVGRKIY